MNKSSLRNKYLNLRSQYKHDKWLKHSNLIKVKLFELDIFRSSNNIHTFISFENEVDTHAIVDDSIKCKKNVFCPKVINKNNMTHHQIFSLKNLERSRFSILEPSVDTPKMDIQPDCILVPGLSFDPQGYRLGYGGGYYDNFLKSQKGIKIGLFFEFQFEESIFHENHDIKLDLIITESKTYTF